MFKIYQETSPEIMQEIFSNEFTGKVFPQLVSVFLLSADYCIEIENANLCDATFQLGVVPFFGHFAFNKNDKIFIYQTNIFYINPFVPNAPLLYPLKTSENRKEWVKNTF